MSTHTVELVDAGPQTVTDAVALCHSLNASVVKRSEVGEPPRVHLTIEPGAPLAPEKWGKDVPLVNTHMFRALIASPLVVSVDDFTADPQLHNQEHFYSRKAQPPPKRRTKG
jgi:hypothetical protein